MNRVDLEQLSLAIATDLPGDWTVRTKTAPTGHTWCATLTQPDGQAFTISPAWHDHDRVIITGRYPAETADTYRPTPRPEITVRASRGPAVLAREITRRFLPPCRERFDAINADNARREREHQARAARLERLTTHLPDAAHVRVSDGARRVDFGGFGGRADITVVTDGPIALSFSLLPDDLAEDILRLLGETIRRKTTGNT
jgi:hypothetical protein